jgi:hypothetical protein
MSMSRTLVRRCDSVRTVEDLAAFLQSLSVEVKPDEMENPNTTSYLEAAGAWVRDARGAYANRGEKFPDLPAEAWTFFARVFDAALVYE